MAITAKGTHMNPMLTVFTPTYNRAYCLNQCYESLIRQTCKDFTWLIIDDGSTDNTREVVTGWIAENKIPIRYHYKENGGMHTAHNAAYELIETELNTCIDSDDWMPDDAVEKIVAFWRQNGSDKYAGMIAMDATIDGIVIGPQLAVEKKTVRLSNLSGGDSKLIYRTDIMKKYPPYPVFAGEKYVGLNYKYIYADIEYPLLILNAVVCIVSYQPDGSSLNMFSQYRRNPCGFAALRKVVMQHTPSLKVKIIQAVHYVAESLLAKNYKFIQESPCKLVTLAATPVGGILYFYIMNTKQKSPFKWKS